jgi:hypothetical protein
MPSTLTVADWKKLARQHPEAAGAEAVPKALESYAKAEAGRDHGALLKAIETVISKAEAAKKSIKKKEVVSYLEKMIKEAEAERKTVEAEKESASADDGEEDKPGEKLLKAQLKRALKCKPEDPRPFVVALGKVSGLVLAKGPTIGGDHKKLARQMRVGNGKLLAGVCYGESGKHVFELAVPPPGGLAKALKKAALVQGEMKIKVLVRGPGVEFDDENDLDEIADLGTDDGDEGEATAPDTGAEAEDSGAGAETPAGGGSDQAKWEKAYAEIEPAYLAALRARPDTADALRKVMGFATEKAEAKEFERALAALNKARDLIGPGSGGPSGASDGAASHAAGMAVWKAAREQVIVQLKKAASYYTASKNPHARGVLIEVQSIIANLTPHPDTPQAVAELERYLSEDDQVLDDAEEIPAWVATVKIREPLLNALKALKS